MGRVTGESASMASRTNACGVGLRGFTLNVSSCGMATVLRMGFGIRARKRVPLISSFRQTSLHAPKINPGCRFHCERCKVQGQAQRSFLGELNDAQPLFIC